MNNIKTNFNPCSYDTPIMVKIKVPMSKPALGTEEQTAMFDVIRSGWLSQGKKTLEFENLLSEYFSSNVVAVNSGTSALICALLANGVRPGDKVIVPDFTFVATSHAAKILGAELLVVDIDPNTLNMDPESLEELVKNSDVKCVIVVDIGGLPVDLDRFTDLSKQYNFTLIEDAAQALGSEYKNKKLGSFNHTTIFSFHIAKQITTVEGGCISTGDNEVYKKLKKIKDLGRSKPGQYVYDLVGGNFRITDIQSALGIEQLKKIDELISSRIKTAEEYKNKIKGLSFQEIPKFVTRHTFMLFFVLAKNNELRDDYLNYLRTNGVDARMTWLPIHQQPCNSELNNYVCPHTETVYKQSFILPIFNNMSVEEKKLVIATLENFESK